MASYDNHKGCAITDLLHKLKKTAMIIHPADAARLEGHKMACAFRSGEAVHQIFNGMRKRIAFLIEFQLSVTRYSTICLEFLKNLNRLMPFRQYINIRSLVALTDHKTVRLRFTKWHDQSISINHIRSRMVRIPLLIESSASL